MVMRLTLDTDGLSPAELAGLGEDALLDDAGDDEEADQAGTDGSSGDAGDADAEEIDPVQAFLTSDEGTAWARQHSRRDKGQMGRDFRGALAGDAKAVAALKRDQTGRVIWNAHVRAVNEQRVLCGNFFSGD